MDIHKDLIEASGLNEQATAARDGLATEVRQRFGAFIDQRVNTDARDRDQNGTAISRELLRDAADLGLVAFTIPSDVGGPGRGVPEWGHVLQEIGYLCEDSAFPLLLAYRGTVCNMLNATGRPDLIERYVHRMAKGESFGGFAFSEGQDPFSFRSLARRTSGGYVVSGEKVPVAGGMTADVFMTFVRREDGDLMCVLIERKDPGVEVIPFEAVGLRSVGLARVRLNDVEISDDRVVVSSDGVSYSQRFFNERRLTLPCWTLGRMRALFDLCVDDLRGRIRYRLPLTEMQAIQSAMGRMHVAIEASHLVVENALEQGIRDGHNALWDPAIAMSKYFVVEQALQVCRTAQYAVGGAAVFSESPYERFMRDFHCLIPIAGTQAILEVDLGILAIGKVERKLRRLDKAGIT